MVKWNTDTMLLDSAPNTDKTKALFLGIDWGRKDWTGVSCPHCHMPHRWRKRTPKRCRSCGVAFLFTASSCG